MSPLIAALYFLCILFLVGFAGYVLARGRNVSLNRYFALLCAALLAWVVTLFAFILRTSPTELLWLGRLNFASVALVGPLVYIFVKELAGRPAKATGWLWAETAAITAATTFLPAVDKAELISGGVHVTQYGPLFPAYVIHVMAYLVVALVIAFRPPARISPERRAQLTVVGVGILATTAVALVTNVLLPYFLGDFLFIHAGTVSTILFIAAVGYAVFFYHLFDVHVIIRATFVFAGLIALSLEFYHATIGFLVRLLPLGDASQRNLAATTLTLVVYSFTNEPIKKWLEKAARRILGHSA